MNKVEVTVIHRGNIIFQDFLPSAVVSLFSGLMYRDYKTLDDLLKDVEKVKFKNNDIIHLAVFFKARERKKAIFSAFNSMYELKYLYNIFVKYPETNDIKDYNLILWLTPEEFTRGLQWIQNCFEQVYETYKDMPQNVVAFSSLMWSLPLLLRTVVLFDRSLSLLLLMLTTELFDYIEAHEPEDKFYFLRSSNFNGFVSLVKMVLKKYKISLNDISEYILSTYTYFVLGEHAKNEPKLIYRSKLGFKLLIAGFLVLATSKVHYRRKFYIFSQLQRELMSFVYRVLELRRRRKKLIKRRK